MTKFQMMVLSQSSHSCQFPYLIRKYSSAARVGTFASPGSSVNSALFLQLARQLRNVRHFGTIKSVGFSPARRPLSTTTTAAMSWEKEAKQDITKYLQETHDRLFQCNRDWAAAKQAEDPSFFANLAAGQSPDYLWIGCSDSRIPAEQITGLGPGEAFVHRNIANLVPNTDLNVMSVINYAVQHLKVKHIVVCGHYGCGGVKAAMLPQDMGVLNPWLRNIRDVYRLHETELDGLQGEERYNHLVELNVMEQCRNVIKTADVQKSYAENRFPIVHGWVFDFATGHLKDLKIDYPGMLKKVQKIYDLTGVN